MNRYLLLLLIFTSINSFSSLVITREYHSIDTYVFVDIKIKDSSNKSKIIHRTFNFFSQVQKSQDLSCLKSVSEASILSKEVYNDFSKLIDFSDRFFKTKYGVQVEKECLNGTTRETLEKNILGSYEQGISCLKKLNGEGSNNLLLKINNLFTTNSPPKIICSEKNVSSKGISWSSTKAYASPNSKFDFPAQGLIHPYISLGDTWRKIASNYEFKSTLFHELIHNTGSIHTETIEYPYACQTCCFNISDDTSVMMSVSESTILEKNVACKICSSDYKGIEDKSYIQDMVELGSFGLHQDKAFHVIKNYMKVHPSDDFSLQQLLILSKFGNIQFHNELKKGIESDNYKGEDNLNFNLAKSIINFSKGKYEESAIYLSKINSLPFSREMGITKKIQDSLQHDLFVLSLSNSKIILTNRTSNHLDNIFKKSATQFNLIINNNKI